MITTHIFETANATPREWRLALRSFIISPDSGVFLLFFVVYNERLFEKSSQQHIDNQKLLFATDNDTSSMNVTRDLAARHKHAENGNDMR